MRKRTFLILGAFLLLSACAAFAEEKGTEVTVTGGKVSGQVTDLLFRQLLS